VKAQQIGQQIETNQPIAPSLISHDLTTITTPAAQMTVFTDFVGYNRMSYNDAFRSSPLFVTYGTQLYDFIRSSNVPQSQLALRVNQLLGLPDSAANGRVNDRVVEVVAPTASIIRPERDPSVTNPTSSVAFPAGTSQTYQNFFYNTLVDSKYVLPPGNVPFPFTQLGYTYDWNNPANIHGLAEFVVLSPKSPNPVNGAAVTGITQVNAVVSLLSYRYYDHQGNFDIQGDVDTVWAGTRYVPQGTYVTVHPGATVSQGITVSSSGYTITNGGSILGPGKNFDRSLRDAVVQFEQGGTVVNLGVIQGEIGISGSASSSDPIAIFNSGIIDGKRFAIQTGGGDDWVTLAGGAVVGAIDGGGGTNTLTFDAGAGNSFFFDSGIFNFQSVRVLSGNVRLDGSVSGNLDLYAGAALSGNAAVQGDLTNHGVLNPGDGNGSGNMQVGGNYVQTAGSTLEIQVAKPLGGVRESNYLNVGGTATFAAGSTIEVGHVAGGQDVFRGGDQFPILFTALPSANIVDQGVNIVTHSAFLRFTPTIVTQSLGYPGNLAAYTLQVSRFAPFTSAAVGANHLSMAAALDLDGNLATGAPAGVVNELLFMDPAQFNAALDPLSPSDYIAAATATLRNTQYQAQAIGNRLRDLRPAMMCFLQSARCCKTDSCSSEEEGDCPPRKDGLNAFVTPTGLFFSQDPLGERVGFQANSAGVLAGADRWLTSEFLAGIAFAYDHDFLSFRGLGGNGNIDSYRVGPYAAWFRDDWFASAWMAYGYDSNIIRRAVPVGALNLAPQGRYSNNGGTVYLEGGRDFRRGKLLITPFGSLQYIGFSQGNFTETNGGGSELRVYAASFNSLRSRMLLQLSRSYVWRRLALTPGLFGGWVHEYLANDPIRARFAWGSTDFLTSPAGIIRDTAQFGANLFGVINQRTVINLRYLGELGHGAQLHWAQLSLSHPY
jgi:uncharacterized protein with beta-barrel porin domain